MKVHISWPLVFFALAMATPTTIILWYTFYLGSTHDWIVMVNMDAYGEGPFEFVLLTIILVLQFVALYKLCRAPITKG